VHSRAAGLRLHLAPIWGTVMSALVIPLADAQRLLLWTTARNVLSAAVRMNLAGTHEAQSILAGLGPLLDEAHAACGALGPADLAQSSPLADLLQGTHDRLYSRLFQS
jgi:urease accessory protein